jgi:hypothetical protein
MLLEVQFQTFHDNNATNYLVFGCPSYYIFVYVEYLVFKMICIKKRGNTGANYETNDEIKDEFSGRMYMEKWRSCVWVIASELIHGSYKIARN